MERLHFDGHGDPLAAVRLGDFAVCVCAGRHWIDSPAPTPWRNDTVAHLKMRETKTEGQSETQQQQQLSTGACGRLTGGFGWS